MTTTILTQPPVNWTNITSPSEEDIQALGHRFPNFHPLHLKDCLTELEYPKIDHHDHYLFLVVQMPCWDEQQKLTAPAEVDIFIAHDELVTIHRGALPAMQRTFATAQADATCRAGWMARGASPLLYHLLDELVNDCFPVVHTLGHNLRHIEGNLFHNNTRHILYEIASLRREIIVIRNILKSQQSIVQELIQGNWPFIQEHLDPYWGDISDHLTQLCSLLDLYSEVIASLADTIDTLASHRIDEVVRLLTVTTILTLPVTLLATIFGMNVVMPFNDHPFLFFGIILMGISLTILLVRFLRQRRWL